MNEIWKSIKEYEGLYEISNQGNIRSLRKNKLMSCQIKKSGYCNINLYKDSKVRTYKVHRLVALAFIPNPDRKPNVDHINKNPSDNRAENLQWLTQAENVRKGFEQGRKIIMPEHCKQMVKARFQTVSTWYNSSLELTFIGDSMDLMRAFPEQELNSRHLRAVRQGKRKQHKNWTCIKGV